MIPVKSVLDSVNDALLTQANGELSIDLFNRFSPLVELDLIDWISGDITGRVPPEPYQTQKDRDFLTPFLVKLPANAAGGFINRPADYYLYDNMYMIGRFNNKTECAENEGEDKSYDISKDSNTPIELLDGSQFYTRCNTYIDELKPSFNKPISKEVGKTFEFMPKDIGSLTLEYIRYPVFAKIVKAIDPDYNNEIVNETLSDNYEWDLKAMPILIWFFVDRFANRTSNQSMKQFNNLSGINTHK